MDAVRPESRSTNWEVNNGISNSRPRASSERDTPRNQPFSRGPEDSRSPSTLPKAFQGMLKTTTETGDIGMFSIKTCRIPNTLNSPRGTALYNENTQRPRQSFQPYGVPGVDDRRRLPSYARDATPEIGSMYETASQKSGHRGYEDPDSRSYSMTQTSYPPYILSKHRSYSSLRSQQDANGLLQRPRSPFAYPARLKRPGFRPSSPALTDGGIIDYSRRAEIERMPNGPGFGTSSPSPLYAQKRKPPLSLRHEANRSTPSLLSQPSPPRRSPSPNTRQSGGYQGDWSRKHPHTSRSSSPARSTFSLASTVNLYANAGSTSTATTPGKLAPPSPAYYDYTEDFDVDEYNQSEPLAPPPTFRIDRSIPEDRPLSAGRPSTIHSEVRKSNSSLKSYVRSSSGGSVLLKSFEESVGSAKGSQDISVSVATSVTTDNAVQETQSCTQPVESNRDTKVIRLSGLGYGARELSSHVEEAFGLPSSPSFEISLPNNGSNAGHSRNTVPGRKHEETETPSARSSGLSFNAHLQRFPHPPGYHNATVTLLDYPIKRELEGRDPVSDTCPSESTASESSTKSTNVISHTTEDSSSSANRNETIESTSSHTSEMGLVDSSAVIPHLPSREPGGSTFSEIHNQPTPNHLHKISIRDKTHLDKISKVSTLGDNHVGSKMKAALISNQVHNRIYQHQQRARHDERLPTFVDLSASRVPNFSHNSRQMAPRSGSPMLAPKPISPARQLKLKNSVPQLMKALPPVPPEPSIRAVSLANRLVNVQKGKSCQSSPLSPEITIASMQAKSEVSQHNPTQKDDLSLLSDQLNQRSETNLQSSAMDIVNPRSRGTEHEKQALPRLKLKGRNVGQRPLPGLYTHSWNQEESYSRSKQDQVVALAPATSEEHLGDPNPEFRLKVIRASESSQGTVRINRGSSESKSLAGLQFHNPKDLFSTTSGLDNMLRQVNKHFYSRKTSSVKSSHESTESSSSPQIPISAKVQTSENTTTENFISDDSISRRRLRPSTAQSTFSDDSSRNYGRHRLRLNFSNLKARITVPYASKNEVRSYDDIHWNDRGAMVVSLPSPLQSVPSLHSNHNENIASHDHGLHGRFDKVHGRKLKAKVKGWLREARSVISARMKSRSSSGKSDEERAQLTRTAEF